MDVALGLEFFAELVLVLALILILSLVVAVDFGLILILEIAAKFELVLHIKVACILDLVVALVITVDLNLGLLLDAAVDLKLVLDLFIAINLELFSAVAGATVVTRAERLTSEAAVIAASEMGAASTTKTCSAEATAIATASTVSYALWGWLEVRVPGSLPAVGGLDSDAGCHSEFTEHVLLLLCLFISKRAVALLCIYIVLKKNRC